MYETFRKEARRRNGSPKSRDLSRQLWITLPSGYSRVSKTWLVIRPWKAQALQMTYRNCGASHGHSPDDDILSVSALLHAKVLSAWFGVSNSLAGKNNQETIRKTNAWVPSRRGFGLA
jgi:hypothetical protein